MADIVLWNPKFFGVKASQVIKGGAQIWSPQGDASGSLSLTEPNIYRESWPACGSAPDTLSAFFVHPSAVDADMAGRWSVSKPMLPVAGTRRLTKADMVRNDTLPDIRVDPQTFEVFADGELATTEPVRHVALGRTYFLR